jgi:hypothetical protein
MPINKQSTLDAVFHVQDRFFRSANIKQDWRSPHFFEGYLLTPTAEALARRIADGLKLNSGQRAWTITGPYGSGKSSFALFLADLLCNSTSSHSGAEKIRKQIGLGKKKLFPLLAVGSRESLGKSMLQLIAEGVEPLSDSLSKEIKRSANKAHPEKEIVAIIQKVIQLSKKKGYAGVLLVLDELGKYLEYASLHPESDLFVLQELAEFSARSGDQEFVFVTVLHSAFSEYIGKAGNIQRAEWQKIQGRFVDVVFQEPIEQFLKLMGKAISRDANSEDLENIENNLKKKIRNGSLQTSTLKRVPLEELLPNCLPIEPVVALLSWAIFRSKLAQNERSLFAFLSSDEPFGFQHFLKNTETNGGIPLYRLENLHDYILNTLGDAVYRGDKSKRWSEIEDALGRLPKDAPSSSASTIKAIGLLSLYGATVGLVASQDNLSLALENPEHLKLTLKFLKEHSLIVYRKHEMSYALWAGSDIDLDVVYDEGLLHSGSGPIALRLAEIIGLRPIVAKAHFIKTGTLRYFSFNILDCSISKIEHALYENNSQADGSINFVLSSSKKERAEAIEASKKISKGSKTKHLRLLAFPKENIGLDSALKEVEAWSWAIQNYAGLKGDKVARQEAQSRLSAAKERLNDIVAMVFGIQGQILDPNNSDWIHSGQLQDPRTAREFLGWLSKLCDRAFNEGPVFKNELLNRNDLSAASAKARRNLLEKMTEKSSEENLGIVGFPPEMSMYAAMLKNGKFHKKQGGKWIFGKPDATWLPAWDLINAFLRSTHKERRPLKTLIEALQQPPYGMKLGPIPVLLCCAILEKKDSIALYDQGVFIPELKTEPIERFLRMPENFEIQEYATSQVERHILASLEERLSALDIVSKGDEASSLLNIVKPLVVFARKLPEYVKQTKRISSPDAVAVRDLLLKAKDPSALIFGDLPKAVGIVLKDKAAVEVFVHKLILALKSLQKVYPQLLDEIEFQLRKEFDLPEGATSEIVRKKIQARAMPLVGRTAEPLLGTVIREAAQLGDRDWREVLGRAIDKGNPVHQWHDSDVTIFQLNLGKISKDFLRLEELVSEQTETGAEEILRVGILNGRASEARAIVSVTREHAPQVLELSDKINKLLGAEGEISSKQVKLAALAKVISRYLVGNSETDEDSKKEALV